MATLEQALAEARDDHSKALAKADKQLAAERARLQQALQQRADELDSQSAAQHQELRAAVQKAEALKKTVAESEASMLRQVCHCGFQYARPHHAMDYVGQHCMPVLDAWLGCKAPTPRHQRSIMCR